MDYKSDQDYHLHLQSLELKINQKEPNLFCTMDSFAKIVKKLTVGFKFHNGNALHGEYPTQ